MKVVRGENDKKHERRKKPREGEKESQIEKNNAHFKKIRRGNRHFG